MSLSKNDIKFLKSLQQKKFRDLEGLFIVEGVKVAQEIIRSDFEIQGVYHTADFELPDTIKTGIEISQKDLERISGLKSPNKVLVVARKKGVTALNTDEDNLVLLLDDVKDPGNLGTIIRTADWFGVTQIICSFESVDLYNPKVVQASMGALFRMNIMYGDLEGALLEFIDAGFTTYGADMEGTSAFAIELPSKTALVLGSESHGLSKGVKSKVEALTIPKFGESESLNVAMASGILMSIYRR